MEIKVECDIDKTVHKLVDTTVQCRVCLVQCADKSYSLFQVYGSITFSKKIMLCTRVKIEEDDGLPHLICEACSKELDLADEFRSKCEDSDRLLRSRILGTPTPADDTLSFLKRESGNELAFAGGYLKSETPDSDDCASVENTIYSKHKKKRSHAVKAEDFRDKNSTNCAEGKVEVTDNTLSKVTFPCEQCGKSLKTKASLESHLKSFHSEQRSQKPGHVTGHGASRRFHCSFCPYSTNRRQILDGHIRTHTGEKPFRCAACGMHFTTSAALCTHRRTHSDKMYFTCAECGKQFKMKDTYERHKNVHIDERNFKCHLCEKALKSNSTLQEHIRRHYNIKNYSCETCGATFVSFSELYGHSMKHSSVKMYFCNLCSFATNKKPSLEIHLKRHSGERPFRCSTCQWTCTTAGALKVHMRKHTKEKNYPCYICEQKFVHSSTLNRHLKKSHGKELKWCDVVDRRVVK